jgi:hypothetical protein
MVHVASFQEPRAVMRPVLLKFTLKATSVPRLHPHTPRRKCAWSSPNHMSFFFFFLRNPNHMSW